MDTTETLFPAAIPPPPDKLSPEEFERHRRELANLFRRYRLNFNDEGQLQGQIQTILTTSGLVHIREARITGKDRPDFLMVDTGIALEVKIHGSVESHLRQMRRYAEHDSVRGIILVCIKPAAVPETLAGKPAGNIALYQGLI